MCIIVAFLFKSIKVINTKPRPRNFNSISFHFIIYL